MAGYGDFFGATLAGIEGLLRSTSGFKNWMRSCRRSPLAPRPVQMLQKVAKIEFNGYLGFSALFKLQVKI
jgi:hypothetical protein